MKASPVLISAMMALTLLTSQLREAVSYNTGTIEIIEKDILPNVDKLDSEKFESILRLLNNIIKANSQVLNSTIIAIEKEEK